MSLSDIIMSVIIALMLIFMVGAGLYALIACIFADSDFYLRRKTIRKLKTYRIGDKVQLDGIEYIYLDYHEGIVYLKQSGFSQIKYKELKNCFRIRNLTHEDNAKKPMEQRAEWLAEIYRQLPKD